MTEHPITPPSELVQQWVGEIWHEGTPVQVAASDLHIARAAADWQLEKVVEWLEDHIFEYMYEDGYFHQHKCFDDLKKAMRPTTTTETP